MTLLDTFFPELYRDVKPEYNLRQAGPNEVILELNVVGLDEDDIVIQSLKNKLMVSTPSNSDDVQYLYRGIHKPKTKHNFQLRDDVTVKKACVKNGILSIILELQVSENDKIKTIPITH